MSVGTKRRPAPSPASTVKPAEMLDDYRTVLERIYAPDAYFARVRSVCRELDRSAHRLGVPWRHVVRDARAFGRIAYRLGWADRSARRAFWSALADCAVNNPRALKIAASFAALYLHLGPFARNLCDRIDEQLGAGAEPLQLEHARPVLRNAGPVTPTC